MEVYRLEYDNSSYSSISGKAEINNSTYETLDIEKGDVVITYSEITNLNVSDSYCLLISSIVNSLTITNNSKVDVVSGYISNVKATKSDLRLSCVHVDKIENDRHYYSLSGYPLSLPPKCVVKQDIINVVVKDPSNIEVDDKSINLLLGGNLAPEVESYAFVGNIGSCSSMLGNVNINVGELVLFYNKHTL
jgi:hypothetical protein